MDDEADYWGDLEYEAAEQRAWDAQETAAQELYDQDKDFEYHDVNTGETGRAIDLQAANDLTLFEALSLSIWDRQLEKPNYYDWFLDTARC